MKMANLFERSKKRKNIHSVAKRSSSSSLLLLLFSVLLMKLILESNEVNGMTVANVSVGTAERTANLSLLINETLTINNRTVPAQINNNQQLVNSDEKPQFRDDWTFDRVEYDLIEFLQELNARYQYGTSGNNSKTTQNSSSLDMQLQPSAVERKESSIDAPELSAKSNEQPVVEARPPLVDNNQKSSQSNLQQKVANHSDHSLDGKTKIESKTTEEIGKLKGISSEKNVVVDSHSTASPQPLPVSLASGDHDISESNWQYGIFDRFTRARSTQQPHHHVPGGSTTPDPFLAASSDLNVRSFNSDECGLRTYVQDEQPQSASLFPASDLLPLSEYDQTSAATPIQGGGEASKELNQRRQRPPLLQQNKRKQSINNNNNNNNEPIDNIENESGSAGGDKHSVSEDQLSGENDQFGGANNNDGLPLVAESEFNLNSRRQWLQQQLGNTLQMLGFNATNQSPAEFSAGQVSMANLSGRENMMKKSAPLHSATAAAMKTSKSFNSNNKVLIKQLEDNEMLVKELDELKARQDELKLEARVIGGTDARLGDSPWSVSLQALVSRPGTGGVEYRHYCGGTIISEYYVLTAAHCLDFMVGRESRLFVVMGDLNWKMSTASMYGQRYGIEKLIIHSGYKSTAFGHDIGLIKTREPIKPVRVNGRYIINSVCLPERNVEHSGEAELVGWGLFSNRNEMADSLQIADVPILPRPLCVDLYRRRTGLIQWLIGIELITEKQICAGTFGRGICQGDSGSALVFNEKVSKLRSPNPDGRASTVRVKSNLARDQQSKATIIGVVAFGGIRRCSYQSLPGVYMQTSKYLDWILPRISA